ncbi:MAG: hypothetical protein KA716_32215 [Gloeotrichia echinulata DEX184]
MSIALAQTRIDNYVSPNLAILSNNFCREKSEIPKLITVPIAGQNQK